VSDRGSCRHASLPKSHAPTRTPSDCRCAANGKADVARIPGRRSKHIASDRRVSPGRPPLWRAPTLRHATDNDKVTLADLYGKSAGFGAFDGHTGAGLAATTRATVSYWVGCAEIAPFANDVIILKRLLLLSSRSWR
jgi:hypothetical protein